MTGSPLTRARSLQELFLLAVAAHGHRPALQTEHGVLSYDQLHGEASALARRLRTAGCWGRRGYRGTSPASRGATCRSRLPTPVRGIPAVRTGV